MSDNVATIEQPVTTTDQNQDVQVAPDVSQLMAQSLWDNMNPTVYQNVEPATPEPVATPDAESQQPTPEPTPAADDIVDLDVYFQREFNMNPTDFRAKWDELNKPKESTQQEIQWANEDSRRLFEAIREGKTEDVYNYLNQQQQLARLEKYDIADANQAAEIIRANLQFKYKDLSSQEIDRLFARQYSMPPQPTQSLDQSDGDFEIAMENWKRQVQEKQTDMIIDAKLAKPELANYKSQIVLPEIQKPQQQQPGPSPEELAAMEAGRKAYLGAVESNYQNFKGYNVTAKDGDVELPISYNISPEEQVASRDQLKDFNVNDFFGQRWFDEKGNPNVTLMQEDLYLLVNKGKILQKTANEAAAQMKAHLIKSQNNIKLNGITQQPAPTQQAPDVNKVLGDTLWGVR